jgi:hypothetical protein
MMQGLSAQVETRPCLICSRVGTRHPVEVLPDGGILFMVAHDDGQICKWAEYSSIRNVTRPERKRPGMPTLITCPKCGDRGRLNWAYDVHATKEERPFTFTYIVVHEQIPGTWGKEKMIRRRRCQSFTTKQRIAILKQVGRYITDPPKPRPVRKTRNDELDKYIESQLQNQNGMKTGEVSAQEKQKPRGQIQQKGPTYVPIGKRLTACTKCNKPGYKYKTFIQHSNEPPIGPRKLRGIQEGWRYRRCSLVKGKVKQNQEGKKHRAVVVEREWEKSTRNMILKKLNRFIDESSSSLSREGNIAIDYKKMYWDLVDNLKMIFGEVDAAT